MGDPERHPPGGDCLHSVSAYPLSAFDRDATAFPSPRSWEFVSRILSTDPDPAIEYELIAGAAGTGAATEFSGFLRLFRDLPSIDAILLNPAAEAVPESPAAQYAVASALAQRAADTNFDRIYTYVARMPMTFRILCVETFLRDAAIKYTAAYVKVGRRKPSRASVA